MASFLHEPGVIVGEVGCFSMVFLVFLVFFFFFEEEGDLFLFFFFFFPLLEGEAEDDRATGMMEWYFSNEAFNDNVPAM